jgi:bifunctional DNase/RNase
VDKPNSQPEEVNLDSVLDIKTLECVTLKVQKMVYTSDGPSVLLEGGGKTYVFDLNDAEATLMSYIAAGCSSKTHLPTIYDLFGKTMTDLGAKLERAVIESKVGDVFYGRLVWRDPKNRVLTTLCCVADAITLSLMLKAQLEAVKNVLEEMTDLDDWPYADHIDEVWS